MRRKIYELQQIVKAEKSKSAKLTVQLQAVSNQNSSLKQSIKCLQRVGQVDVLEQQKLN